MQAQRCLCASPWKTHELTVQHKQIHAHISYIQISHAHLKVARKQYITMTHLNHEIYVGMWESIHSVFSIAGRQAYIIYSWYLPYTCPPTLGGDHQVCLSICMSVWCGVSLLHNTDIANYRLLRVFPWNNLCSIIREASDIGVLICIDEPHPIQVFIQTPNSYQGISIGQEKKDILPAAETWSKYVWN